MQQILNWWLENKILLLRISKLLKRATNSLQWKSKIDRLRKIRWLYFSNRNNHYTIRGLENFRQEMMKFGLKKSNKRGKNLRKWSIWLRNTTRWGHRMAATVTRASNQILFARKLYSILTHFSLPKACIPHQTRSESGALKGNIRNGSWWRHPWQSRPNTARPKTT